jgi:hypothetical protein
MRLHNYTTSNSILQAALSSEVSLTPKKTIPRPILSMIWLLEPDGDRQHLVAHWVLQD